LRTGETTLLNKDEIVYLCLLSGGIGGGRRLSLPPELPGMPPSTDMFHQRPQLQYALIANPFQMKSMKVSGNLKSMMDKGFEYD
jgi:hypothetical protein